jgi:hypothetical protein
MAETMEAEQSAEKDEEKNTADISNAPVCASWPLWWSVL